MKKKYIVIGLGRYGRIVSETLEKMGEDVLAIDIDSQAVSQVAKTVSHCVVADATKKDVLDDLGAENYDHAVVAIGNNLEASILAVTNLKRLGVKKITVRVDEEDHKEIFKLLGADEIIIPEEAAGFELANQIQSDVILEYRIIYDDYIMSKLLVTNDFSNTNLIDLNIRGNYDVNIVGIIRNNKFFIPKGTDTLLPNDVVVAAGKKNAIRRLSKLISEKK